MPRPPVCLILGAGRGIGSGVAEIFANNGFHVVCVRRKDRRKTAFSESNDPHNQQRISWRFFDVADGAALRENVADIRASLGPIHAMIFNLGANMGNLSLMTTDLRTFEQALRRGATAAFLAARAVVEGMLDEIERSSETPSSASSLSKKKFFLGFTGATASLRGSKGHAAHAAGMHARRGLAQALAHELSPKGIHVAHVVVDAAVDAPDTLGRMVDKAAGIARKRDSKRAAGGNSPGGTTSETNSADSNSQSSVWASIRDRLVAEDRLVLPSDVGAAYWYLYSQTRSAWTFELDLRPSVGKAWWAETSSDLEAGTSLRVGANSSKL